MKTHDDIIVFMGGACIGMLVWDTVEDAYKFAVAQCQMDLAEILCDDEGAVQFKSWVSREISRIRRQNRGDI